MPLSDQWAVRTDLTESSLDSPWSAAGPLGFEGHASPPKPTPGSLEGLYWVFGPTDTQGRGLGTRIQTRARCLWASEDPHLDLEPRDQPAHPDGGPSTRRQSPGSH